MIQFSLGNTLENWKKCPLVELSGYENFSHKKKGEKVKRGIENSVRKWSCSLTRVSVSREMTVFV